MKYSTEIEINLPVKRVVELFNNQDNLKYWQPELQSFEHMNGTPGEQGAKSRLTYKMGKRDVEMIETILENKLPDEFKVSYEAKGVYNIVTSYFRPVSDDKTLYVNDQEFRFEGFMKFFSKLMPGAFKKQSYKYLNQFKDFVENADEANLKN